MTSIKSAFTAAIFLSCLHTPVMAEVLRFDVQQKVTTFGKTKNLDKTDSRNFKRTVGIAENAFSLQDSNSSEKVIYDFATKRIRHLNEKAGSFYETSLFANVAFRRAEYDNRIRIKEVLTRIAPTSNQYDPVQLACLFGFVPPSDKTFALLKKKETTSGTTFSYKDKVIASYSLSKTKVAPLMVPTFNRYLLFNLNLHPLVRQSLISKAAYPQQVSYWLENPPILEETELHKLAEVQSAAANCSVGSAKKVLRKENPIRKILTPLAGQKPAPDFRQKELVFCTRAISQKKYVDAMLGALEYVIQTGDNLPGVMEQLREKIKTDKAAQKLKRAMGSPSSIEEAKAFLADLNSLSAGKPEKGYLLDLFKANLTNYLASQNTNNNTKQNVGDTESLFLKVLAVNPFLTGAYKDLGAYYFNRFQMVEAWECWDAARQFYPRNPALRTVDEIEARLQLEVPEFFTGKRN